jgi:hypothetical protein
MPSQRGGHSRGFAQDCPSALFCAQSTSPVVRQRRSFPGPKQLVEAWLRAGMRERRLARSRWLLESGFCRLSFVSARLLSTYEQLAVSLASSALSLSARALRALFEPLTPRLRRARRDTWPPARASSRAILRAWSMSGPAARGAGTWYAATASWPSPRGSVTVRPGGRSSVPVRSGGFWSGWSPDWSAGGPHRSHASGWSGGVGLSAVRCCGVLAEHVGEGGPHAQDQDREAGHEGGDGLGRRGDAVLVHEVERDLTGHAEREGEDRRSPREPPGPFADRAVVGEPGAQRVGRVALDSPAR